MMKLVSSFTSKIPAFNTRRSTIQDKIHAHTGQADEEFLALSAKEMFETVDADKDGKIDQIEFEHLHKVLTVRPSLPPVWIDPPTRPAQNRPLRLALRLCPFCE
jgi:hypothetical protein